MPWEAMSAKEALRRRIGLVGSFPLLRPFAAAGVEIEGVDALEMLLLLLLLLLLLFL